MKKNILVTGGFGFLGQYVVKALCDEWQAKIGIIDLKKPAHPYYDFEGNPHVKVFPLDISNYEELVPAFKDVDIVIHLIGLVSSSVKDKEKFFQINVSGTENILRAMAAPNVSRLIHISSVAGFGYRGEGDEPIDESFQFDWEIARKLRKYYMLTKHLGDELVIDYRNKGLDSIYQKNITETARVMRR